MDEKIAMGDGRFDRDKLIKTVNEQCARGAAHRHGGARQAERLDRQRGDARRHRRLRQRLPLTPEQLEAAIRADGKSVDGNLRGFRAGLAAARAKLPPAKRAEKKRNAPSTPDLLEHEVAYSLPALAQPIAIEGVRRLIAYQSAAYAKLYLDRLRALVEADAAAGAPGKLLKEVARHLAVRMSYEDVVRVAQAKIAPERMRRIAREELRVNNEPYSVHDFLKPGIEELTPIAAAVPGAADPALAANAAAGSAASISAWRSIRPRSAAICASCCWPSCAGLRPHGHPLQAGAGADRILARPDREAAQHSPALGARSRRMRPPDQGLWRHACARACQLPP